MYVCMYTFVFAPAYNKAVTDTERRAHQVISVQHRGVAPSDSHRYSIAASSTFTCKDGSSVPFSTINDNYCDCPVHGDDEPGTNACNNGSFYCLNEGQVSSYYSRSLIFKKNQAIFCEQTTPTNVSTAKTYFIFLL